MKILKIYRTFREGLKNFVRNGWVSLATISVMVLSLYIMSVTVSLGFAGRSALETIEKQLNISIYFELDVEEARVLEIQSELEQYQEIASIEFVSKDEALDRLLETDGENEDIRKALDEIGTNPLWHSLVIRAVDPSQYESIDATLKSSVFANEIDSINYDRNKAVIARLNMFLVALQKIGLATALVFLMISILITYNAVRLTLFSQRKEFEIMRLVGASNLYIKLPSIFEGMLYGLVASLVTLLFLGLSGYYLLPLTEVFVGEKVFYSILISYWWIPVIALPLLGIFLGMLSSWIAIRKYLKI